MEESLRRLKSPRIELMQVHNLVGLAQHLPTLRAWKADGRIRYLGISHYTASAYAEVEAVLRSEQLDFLQINYSLAGAGIGAAPAAAGGRARRGGDRQPPLRRGRAVRPVKGKPLPAAAADHGCRSWAQLFLRWILAHPAVSCADPGQQQLDHLEDNMAAGVGPLPTQAEQKALARMAGF
jgi:aryl-alcohol dehydrogenase-like predicted oxidoreductase